MVEVARHRGGGSAETLRVAQAACLILLSHGALKIAGFRLVVKTLRRGPPGAADLGVVARVARAIDRAGDRLGATCLRRAFAAAWMLQAHGIHPTLHYGVAKRGELTIAHAWLEVDGIPVTGHALADGFALLASFPSR
jgi:hypothetical protein